MRTFADDKRRLVVLVARLTGKLAGRTWLSTQMSASKLRQQCALLIAIAALTSGCCVKPYQPPDHPPTVPVDLTGGGQDLAAVLGAKGGRLRLGRDDGLPTLFVPARALPEDGRTFRLKRAADSRPPKGTPLSIPFEITPATDAAIGHTFTISSTVANLPEKCKAPGLRIAVERPNDVGPADGTSTPALRWDYDRAGRQGSLVVANVIHIYSHRLRFVCLLEEEQ